MTWWIIIPHVKTWMEVNGYDISKIVPTEEVSTELNPKKSPSLITKATSNDIELAEQKWKCKVQIKKMG